MLKVAQRFMMKITYTVVMNWVPIRLVAKLVASEFILLALTSLMMAPTVVNLVREQATNLNWYFLLGETINALILVR